MAPIQSLPSAALWDSLPTEIQNIIWEFVFINDRQIRCPDRAYWRPGPFTKREYLSVQLLRINKRFFERHFPTFWAHNFFRMSDQVVAGVHSLWQPRPSFCARIQTISVRYDILEATYTSLTNFGALKRVFVDWMYIRDEEFESFSEDLSLSWVRGWHSSRPVSSNGLVDMMERCPQVEFTLLIRSFGSTLCFSLVLDQNDQLKISKINDIDPKAQDY